MSTKYPEPFWLKWIPGGRFTFRFLTGRPLDGIRRTDAIFHKRGRKSMDPSGYATAWSLLAGYQRLLFRLGIAYLMGWSAVLCLAAGIRSVYGYVGIPAPEWAERATWDQVLIRHLLWMGILGSLPALYFGIRHWGITILIPSLEVRRSRSFPWFRVAWEGFVPHVIEGRRTWDRRYVRPVAAAAQSILGTGYHPKESGKWVMVPRNFRNPDGKPVVIALPAGYTGSDEGQKRRLVAAVGNRLGLRDPSASWDLEGERPRLLISAPPVPPGFVGWADVRDAFLAAPEYELVLGLTARREVLKAHMKGDSPHIAVSCGPGGGKSEHIKGIIMLALGWGWRVVILDWKEVSQEWAEGLPGVMYVTDIADIHDTAVWLGEEVDRRKRAYRQDKEMRGRAKILVVAEEMNVTAPLLTGYWDNLRNTEPDPEIKRAMPRKSPAIDGLMAVNFGGRQFRMFMVYVAQRLSARVTNGNADLRESFQIRLLNRASRQTWAMLAPQIKPVPKMSTKEGRFAAVIGEDCVQYQAALITDEEAREYVLGRRPATFGDDFDPIRPASPNGACIDHDLGQPLGNRPTVPNQRQRAIEGELLTSIDARKLSEMTEPLAHLGITLNILQHARKDPDSGFPQPCGGSPNRGYTYDFRQVTEWARRRHAALSAEREVR